MIARRRLSRWTAMPLVAALLTAGCGDSPPEGLLLITIDTCRADRVGCYGAGGLGSTPAIDALAERGTVFLEATAPTPITLPSHCSLLTGLYPDRHTVRNNGAGRLPEEAVTLAEILSAQGWRTAAFVSAVPLGSEFGTDQGFDVYDETLTGSGGGAAATDPKAGEVAGRFFFQERLASETADACIPWIREALAEEAPFFAWVHFFDPHAVYRPPPRHAARWGPNAYEGEIAFVDEQIGRILEAMGEEEARILKVVTADHGESLGEHGERSHGLFIYESTLRVPWVLAGPGIPEGRRVAGPVSLVDVMPTALEALGLPGPAGLDGTARLEDAGRGVASPGDVLAESLLPLHHFHWAGLHAVRRGRWKLVDAPRVELFDVEADPEESRDLAVEHPEVVAELREALAARALSAAALVGEPAAVDPVTRERLDRLGYVGPSLGRVPDAVPGTGRDPKDMVDAYHRFQEVPTLLLDGKWGEAEEALTELRAEDPGNPRVIERLAMLRSLQERWAEARDLCRAYLAIVPDDRKIRENLAGACAELQDAEGEITARREIVARAPSDLDARVTLADALERAGRIREAELEFDRALVAEPRALAALNGKALLLSHTGRAREAVRILEEALSFDSRDLDALNNLAWILANESIDAERAHGLARRAAALAPDDPAVLDTLGWAAIRTGRFQEAITPLSRALEATGDPEVRAHLGVALAESGRVEEGRAHVRTALAEREELGEVEEIARWR